MPQKKRDNCSRHLSKAGGSGKSDRLLSGERQSKNDRQRLLSSERPSKDDRQFLKLFKRGKGNRSKKREER